MAEGPGVPPPQAPRRGNPLRGRSTPPAGRGGGQAPASFRERLRRDPFLFALCLGFLAFTTWGFAVSWRLLNDPVLLAISIGSVLPAFYLFYLRDGPGNASSGDRSGKGKGSSAA